MKAWFTLVSVLMLCSFPIAQADPQAIYSYSVQGSLQDTYDKVQAALENHRFYVVFEANIGRNLSNFAEQWEQEYNRNQLDGIRSMVFCNPWYANQVSNADPELLALCPLHITVTHKQGTSTVLMIRPSIVAAGSKGLAIAKKLEQELVNIIEEALPTPVVQ